MHDLLTVIVCTRNRAEHLERCIEALTNQSVSEDRFNILIVDNDSTDSTPDLIAAYIEASSNIGTVCERRVGLSHARNAGYERSSSEWVAYLDDDGIPHSDWAEKLLLRIETGEFDGIGGYYQPYFDNSPPAWYLSRYNSNSWLLRKDARCYSIGATDSKFCGGNCAFRRSLLVELGGFSLELGMRDGQLGFGEEVELQDRVLEAGYRLGFDADVRMDHFTPLHKQQLTSFLARSFSNGRDMARADGARHRVVSYWFFHVLLREGIRVARAELRAVRTSWRHLSDGSYRWQNAVIECGEPLAGYVGRLYGILSGREFRRRSRERRSMAVGNLERR